jgi:hypothetical protein
MHRAVVVNDAAATGVAVPDSIVVHSPGVVHPSCDCPWIVVASTEKELTKPFEIVECRVAAPRAAALRRFLVIMFSACNSTRWKFFSKSVFVAARFFL